MMERLKLFDQHRSLLFAIAYRMLGSVTEAEDMIQEAWIRWQTTTAIVQSPKAYLLSLITRLCIDHLRSARVRREQYVGTWLPEPLLTTATRPDDPTELAESLSMAFLVLLECLSPTERAVFLLREVFEYDYWEIAETVGKSVVNCRQIVRRARQHLRLRPGEQCPPRPQQDAIVEQFLHCWHQGDLPQLMALLTEDVRFWADGGGQVTAARHPLQGGQKVARFLLALRRSPIIPPFQSALVVINQQPGILNQVADQPQSTFSFAFSGHQIAAIFAVVNPAKLRSFDRDLSSEALVAYSRNFSTVGWASCPPRL